MQQMLELLGSYFRSAYFLSIHSILEREEIGLKNTKCAQKAGQNMIGRGKERREYTSALPAIHLKVNT